MPTEPVELPGRALRHRYESPFWRRVMLTGIRLIPQSVQLATMPLWAGIFWLLVPRARRTIEGNLRRALGDASACVMHARSFRLFVNYAQSVANMYALYLDLPVPLETVFEGRERLAAVREQGRGVIIATAHLGSWAIGGFLLAQHGFGAPVMAMAEEPNAATQAFEERFRKRFRVIYTTGSPFASLELASVLRRGESVGMHIDRHQGGATMDIEFFGQKAPFPLGPATLARATGAPIVPVFMLREGRRGFRSIVEEPIEVARTSDRMGDLRQATERLVRVYETYVRRYPYQWFNFHDFWASPPLPLLPLVQPARKVLGA